MHIKTGPVASLTVEELTVAKAHLGLLIDRIVEDGNTVPDGLKKEFTEVSTELANRQRGDKERQLQLLRMRRESYLTVTEKRQRDEAEIARLEQELGLTPTVAAPAARAAKRTR